MRWIRAALVGFRLLADKRVAIDAVAHVVELVRGSRLGVTCSTGAAKAAPYRTKGQLTARRYRRAGYVFV